ncbi:Lactococcin-G-processing and transport ATP-binding protein LagD [Enhygromyxa salina]|uniref:Lactococcin-G-processing and transport ATP-binding protein LagD n=2 Tax=Enhygromyxa salina TaxID=215803 RepID=A0A2S9XPN4_9BACT|nr:Lactococcin-G-processing and transport ATP-binding protein LagD [Enhygromyxa salina]
MVDRAPSFRSSFRAMRQHDAMDCGPTCLRMIARHHGSDWSLGTLRERCDIARDGVSLDGVAAAAESIGLRSLAVMANYDQLASALPLPCIIHWNQNHFVVVVAADERRVRVADPAAGLVILSREEVLRRWTADEGQGVALVLEPTPAFFTHEGEQHATRGFASRWPYFRPYRRLIVQLMLGMSVASLLGLVFPFLTQALVDVGIGTRDIGFVYAVLLAQLMLFAGRTAIEMIRAWILLHVGQRVFIAMLTGFLAQLLRLPMSFFDTRTLGDVLQRVADHDRVETFLTAGPLEILFSFVNVAVLSVVIAIYSPTVLAVFLIGTALATGWIVALMGRRQRLDQEHFEHRTASQNALVELVEGISELKLNDCERRKRWDWEKIQVRLFRVNKRRLALEQVQSAGSMAINEAKNIVITFIAAREVIAGEMTLGMMLALSWVVGQVARPLERTLAFVSAAQDAKFSIDRLDEIHEFPEEQPADRPALRELGSARSLVAEGVSFRYPGSSRWVLHDVDLEIPAGKTTALVGASGSGKTTLLKLLLGFYTVEAGQLTVGSLALDNLDRGFWRRQCGVVMQDGHIFADTIAGNVAVGFEVVDVPRLLDALETANLREFVESLPLAWKTRIGSDGVGLSQGQRQRILIARAVYADPQFLFFDEATSALDATNERQIMDRLREFQRGRTSLVIAHRLSTVRDADQIIVLDRGKVVERGTHEELTALAGTYYQLVKNQLELGG